jgi:hypothetical protein
MKTMRAVPQIGFIRNQVTEKQGGVGNPPIDDIDPGLLPQRSMSGCRQVDRCLDAISTPVIPSRQLAIRANSEAGPSLRSG